ncbi:MAG: DsbC family protein [Candidatus Micrarchaeia archaeon]
MKKLITNFVLRKSKEFCLSLFLVLISVAVLYAYDPLQNVPLSVRDRIVKTLPQYGNPKIEKVTDIGGLYEVIVIHSPIGEQIVEKRGVFYVTKEGNYVIFGPVIGDNYNTYAVLRSLDRIDVSKINTDSAVKIVKGDGSKKIFVFTDPDCPFCKRLQNYLKGQNNYTAYVYFYPLEDIHPGVTIKIVKSLCAKDVSKSVEKLLFEHEEDFESKVCESGKNRLEQMMKYALKLGLEGTPMVITGDGRYIRGADTVTLGLYLKSKNDEEKKGTEKVEDKLNKLETNQQKNIKKKK